jgi:hypothetical protein
VAEVMTPLIPLTEGLPYTPGADEYVITERHTLNDILRHVVSESDLDEVRTFVALQERE